mmetsp:Transcript_77829/g.152757  ORF Transcript_77829/g.152757 Transcript_77829/m.152757 type:complete len:276 (+) Transcript_77829:99-926(+)
MSWSVPPGYVDCGGHFARACILCPESYGRVWCNGQCEWIPGLFGGGECVEYGFVPGLPNPETGGLLAHIVWWFTSFLGSAFIMFIFAAVYKKQVIQKMNYVSSIGHSSPKGLFDCFFDRSTCLYTTFCLPVVLGKNYEATAVLGFWPGCVLSFLFSYSPFHCIGAVVRIFLARQVQDKLGHERSSNLMLCLTNLFCLPCAVGKESLEVDDAAGNTITCCCKVEVQSCVVNAVEDVAEAAAEAVEAAAEAATEAMTHPFTKMRVCGGQGNGRICHY